MLNLPTSCVSSNWWPTCGLFLDSLSVIRTHAWCSEWSAEIVTRSAGVEQVTSLWAFTSECLFCVCWVDLWHREFTRVIKLFIKPFAFTFAPNPCSVITESAWSNFEKAKTQLSKEHSGRFGASLSTCQFHSKYCVLDFVNKLFKICHYALYNANCYAPTVRSPQFPTVHELATYEATWVSHRNNLRYALASFLHCVVNL